MKFATIFAAIAVLASTATAASAGEFADMNRKYLTQETEFDIQPGDNAVLSTLRVGTTLGFNSYLEVGTGIGKIGSDEFVPVVAEIGTSKLIGDRLIWSGDVEYMYIPEKGDHSATVTSKFFYLF